MFVNVYVCYTKLWQLQQILINKKIQWIKRERKKAKYQKKSPMHIIGKVDYRYTLGNSLQKFERFEEALEAYEEAICALPTNVDAINGKGGDLYLSIGFVLDILGQHEKAIVEYTKAIEIDPKFILAYNNRGLAYDKMSNYHKAIEEYTKVFTIDKQYYTSYFNRAIAYYKLKNYDRAVEDFSTVIEINPEYYMAYYHRGEIYELQNKMDQASKDYVRASQLEPCLTIPYPQFKKIPEKSSYETSYQHLSLAIQDQPDNILAYNNRGFVLFEMNQPLEALENYNKAIEIKPTIATLYYNRGNIAYFLNQFEKAIEDYSQTILIDPNYAKAYCNRGTIYKQLEKFDEAKKDIEIAVKIDPQITTKRNFSFDLSLFALPKNPIIQNIEKAVEAFTGAIELSPQMTQAYQQRGIAYFILKQYEESLKDFSQVLLLEPNNKEVHFQIGCVIVYQLVHSAAS
ncbi:unnamed protein product (macronuclear) [Paramecium tetraurelia]|uniref:Uncharacterized protein n=1 Tax=Paramecium tetraurelia TaxID=5888 RepID=A0C682_PARTE|nr:uncharacterized protein GSPATT00035428001 [Paramecium tetraurelia]CAK66299.1 unnamed protein product [Paramecium tetraurelia]|eukprot:XP_001433696.1 hypothetical protein (macronuclear) [Paramecium tetraurelia strain d4-2]